MNTRKRLAAALSIATLSTLTLSGPAGASVVSRSCDVDGHILNAEVNYTLTSTKHIWNSLEAVATGSATSGHNQNNFEAWLNVNSTKIWGQNSADSYSKDEPWTRSIGKTTNRADNEDFKIKAIFDEPGNDDECTVTWNY